MTPRPASLLRTLAGLPARAGLLLVRAYQRFVSPALPASCRYHPSCSEYAYLAIGEWGLVRGSLLAAWRILRCNPWSPGGFDMPPRRRAAMPGAAARRTGAASCAPTVARPIGRAAAREHDARCAPVVARAREADRAAAREGTW